MHWELCSDIGCNYNLKKRFNVHLVIIEATICQLKNVGHDEVHGFQPYFQL